MRAQRGGGALAVVPGASSGVSERAAATRSATSVAIAVRREPGVGEAVVGQLVADLRRRSGRRRASRRRRPPSRSSITARTPSPSRSPGSRRPAPSRARARRLGPRRRSRTRSRLARREPGGVVAALGSSRPRAARRAPAAVRAGRIATATSPPNQGRDVARRSRSAAAGRRGAAPAARSASCPLNSGSCAGQVGEGRVLVGVRVEVGVQVGERVRGDEPRPHRRAAGSCRRPGNCRAGSGPRG